MARLRAANNLNHEASPTKPHVQDHHSGKTYHDPRRSSMGFKDDDAIRRAGYASSDRHAVPDGTDRRARFREGLERSSSSRKSGRSSKCSPILYGRANARIIGKYDPEERRSFRITANSSPTSSGARPAPPVAKTRMESAEAWLKRLDEIHDRSKVVTLAPARGIAQLPHNTSVTAGERHYPPASAATMAMG
jgi:indolepyruvate ferredoxin oxidoreductase